MRCDYVQEKVENVTKAIASKQVFLNFHLKMLMFNDLAT